ncbi:PASTA domain-containing protein [Nocardia speluncae]|uniref:PASTA domain-containing protein n=1 Tax=Nocardia speluncae TaxID=419477 RepID=A0A846XBU8_9NOCA|nr:PASTA domain-containing protein [Nocardia speluncae]NKY32260.1 PASTA domain-containing protein [Nocardia speluncae]
MANPHYPQQSYGAYPPPPPKKTTPKWVIVSAVVGALLVIGMIGNALGGGKEDSTENTMVPIASTPAATTPAFLKPAAPAGTDVPVMDLTVPDLAGTNGEIAAERLEDLGFTNVQYASATPGKDVVLLRANWTVQSVEPGPGTVVPSDSTVVVTMTKNNA